MLEKECTPNHVMIKIQKFSLKINTSGNDVCKMSIILMWAWNFLGFYQINLTFVEATSFMRFVEFQVRFAVSVHMFVVDASMCQNLPEAPLPVCGILQGWTMSLRYTYSWTNRHPTQWVVTQGGWGTHLWPSTSYTGWNILIRLYCNVVQSLFSRKCWCFCECNKDVTYQWLNARLQYLHC